MELKDFTNHSGGCQGSDMAWDEIGRRYGFENHIHWRPEHLKNLTPEGHRNMLRDFNKAAEYLGRPTIFKGVELAQRDWLQAFHSDAVFAIARIIAPGEYDGTPTKHFRNNTDHENVSGGSAWACTVAMQMNKPIYVFDMNKGIWMMWSFSGGEFRLIDTPILTECYAGIGSRNITTAGKAAIESVYKKTLQHV